MKQHSYAFYTGWLSNEYLRKQRLEKELQFLDDMNPPEPDITDEKHLESLEHDSNLLESRTTPDPPSNAKHGSPGNSSIPTKQENPPNGLYRTPSLVEERERLLHEIDATERDLTGKVSGRNKYPNNLTFGNFLDYMVCPTLVYELEYPRTDKYSSLFLWTLSKYSFRKLFSPGLVSEWFVSRRHPPN